MGQIHRCLIKEVNFLNSNYFNLKLYAPEISKNAEPGQFLNLQTRGNNSLDPLLKRPFSIHQIDPENGTVELLIKIVGRGTVQLATKRPGDFLEVIGPSGRGFRILEKGSALLVAGGIGVAPLTWLANELKTRGVEITFLLGVTDEKDLILSSVVSNFEPEIIVVNPENPGFKKGYVTELVEEKLAQKEYDQIYSCGPNPMLKALQKTLGHYTSIAQFSLEERMGCGVGLCFSCVTKVKKSEEKTENRRICTCGPVFFAHEVILP